MAFVRSSKFRHVLGTPAKKDKCYDTIKITRGPHESDMSSINSKFLAVVTEVQGGGAFLVLPVEKVGRVDINYPKVVGHKGPVLDVAWNPFDDNEIASGSEDSDIMLWDIPDGGLKEDKREASLTLKGHQRKVQHLRWHPSAANVLASAGNDFKIIVWNTETGVQLMKTSLPDMVYSISWDYNGSCIAATCKDKKIRVFNARTGETLQEGTGHEGTKPSRVVFCGKTNRLFTTGFSKMSERQFALWDPESLSAPLTKENIDNGSGVLFPFWDEGTHMVYLVGKGDQQLRYYEVNIDKSPYVFFLTLYTAQQPSRSACVMPKRFLDVMKCEVMRFFMLQKNTVEPVAMTVPRKADSFQEDIFPDCPSGEAALTVEEWVGGTDKDPLLMALGGVAASTGPVKKKVTAVKRPAASSDGVRSGEPANLEEYRKAYKLLEQENRDLKKKLGM